MLTAINAPAGRTLHRSCCLPGQRRTGDEDQLKRTVPIYVFGAVKGLGFTIHGQSYHHGWLSSGSLSTLE